MRTVTYCLYIYILDCIATSYYKAVRTGHKYDRKANDRKAVDGSPQVVMNPVQSVGLLAYL